jgi:enoyl-CoA hydratase/carnithine racemase
MSDDKIQITRDGAVQIIRLNRPDKMYSTMTDALAAAEADDAIRAHVFLGVPGAFSSGNDLKDFMAFAMEGAMGTEVLDFLMQLVDLKKPVVSGVDGLAIGIGTTIHLHCDMTFATPRSQFRTPFVDLALVPEAASSLLAPAIMGHQRAYAMLAMGEGFSAEAAREAGLIWKISDEATLEDDVMRAAHSLAEKPPVALALAKRLMKSDPEQVRTCIRDEGRHFADQLMSDEAKAAFMAFMAKSQKK